MAPKELKRRLTAVKTKLEALETERAEIGEQAYDVRREELIREQRELMQTPPAQAAWAVRAARMDRVPREWPCGTVVLERLEHASRPWDPMGAELAALDAKRIDLGEAGYADGRAEIVRRLTRDVVEYSLDTEYICLRPRRSPAFVFSLLYWLGLVRDEGYIGKVPSCSPAILVGILYGLGLTRAELVQHVPEALERLWANVRDEPDPNGALAAHFKGWEDALKQLRGLPPDEGKNEWYWRAMKQRADLDRRKAWEDRPSGNAESSP